MTSKYIERYDYSLSKYIFFDFFPMIRYYPCIKYQIPADPEIDGTDTFIMAESMKLDLFKIQLWNSQKQVFLDLNLEPNFQTHFLLF